MKPEKMYIYGRHALMEALRSSPHILDRVYLDASPDAELSKLIAAARVAVERFDSKTMPHGVYKEATHQGCIGRVTINHLVRNYGDFVADLTVGPDSCIVVLGELQDPQNVGAVIRTAAAFGIAGVLIPEHNQAQVTGTVVKVSAGMAFRIPLVTIGNVNDTLRDLKERGFWVYGLDVGSKQSIGLEPFDAPTVFVLGNEASGIRQKTLELCDVSLSIPMSPDCESMNVAASAAVALYAWSTKHPKALKQKQG